MTWIFLIWGRTMPKMKLNEKAIAKMAAPDPSGRQVLYWDTDMRGFAVLCSGVTNAKTYVVQRDLPNGRTRRVTVGSVAEITLGLAREQAADFLHDMRRGLDPKSRGTKLTLREALDAYLEARKDLRPASIRAYRISLGYLASWADQPLRSITPEMVEARHRSITKEVSAKKRKDGCQYSGQITANMTMRMVRLVWNFFAERSPELGANPVRRLRRQWYKEPRRTRYVLADNLPEFYKGILSLDNKIARDFILLLLFTGMRKTETASLRWEDVDLKNRVIRIPATRTKSGRKHDLPMSDFVRDLLIARRSLGDAKFVFPSPGPTGHITSAFWALSFVEKACGIKVSAHVLRRTYLTVAESCEISPLALKALANHSTGNDVTAGYVQLSSERLREAAQRVADKMKELCEIKAPKGNIAKIK
jgi:integrase